jgi:hypothetical protein
MGENMTERVLNFVNAGDQDVSEVKISTGVHPAGPANPLARVTYTISYPDPKDGGKAEAAVALKESFIKAADCIIEDAKERNATPGHT